MSVTRGIKSRVSPEVIGIGVAVTMVGVVVILASVAATTTVSASVSGQNAGAIEDVELVQEIGTRFDIIVRLTEGASVNRVHIIDGDGLPEDAKENVVGASAVRFDLTDSGYGINAGEKFSVVAVDTNGDVVGRVSVQTQVVYFWEAGN